MRSKVKWLICFVLCCTVASWLCADDKGVEFSRKPSIVRTKDQVEISFAVNEFCDATVAIEDKKGNILRHLASGVLGPNAPIPFAKNSKSQSILWDGKDDQGRYVAQDDNDYKQIQVRVSLGLKARFERTLFWAAKKRPARDKDSLWTQLACPAPEGVYVYDGGFGDHVKLYSHEGEYIRTVYPFPADKVKDVKGLRMHRDSTPRFPMPLKWNRDMSTVLTMGWWSYGGKNWPDGRKGGGRTADGNSRGDVATVMAVHGKKIALARVRLNRLAVDGSSGGLPVHGPDTWFRQPGGSKRHSGAKPTVQGALMVENGEKFHAALPSSMAFSPDGKWLYMTGYLFPPGTQSDKRALPGVARMAYAGKERAECWVGSMTPGKDGIGDGEFCYPTALDVDSKGRVYVCDYMNSRIQIFSPEAKLLKVLKTPYPADIRIHPETGELYVFSWPLGNSFWAKIKKKPLIKPTLTRFSTYPEFKKGQSYPLPHEHRYKTNEIRYDYGWGPAPLRHIAVDFYSEKPMLWITESPFRKPWWKANWKMFEIGTDTLTLKRDFGKDLEKEICLAEHSEEGRMRVYVDPKRNVLYVYGKNSHVVRIDPESGKDTLVKRPFNFTDMTFDINGHAYFRSGGEVVRYVPLDSGSWREVPFDYGEERSVGYASHHWKAISTLMFAGNHSSHQQYGGIDVNAVGNVVVATPCANERGYKLKLYPGRSGNNLVSIFDRHGKMIVEDAFMGAKVIDGVRLDRQNNVYCQVSGLPTVKGKLPPGANLFACTLIKGKPGSVKMYSRKGIGLTLPDDRVPDRPADFMLNNSIPVWVEGAEWMFKDVGLSAFGTPGANCHCSANARFDLDEYARSFATQVPHFRIAVLDTNGNLITHIGRCGNVDEGMPLIKKGGPPNPRSIGGDEVAIMNCLQLTVHTDKRLFLSDIGNHCIRSVKLDYHVSERVAVKSKE